MNPSATREARILKGKCAGLPRPGVCTHQCDTEATGQMPPCVCHHHEHVTLIEYLHVRLGVYSTTALKFHHGDAARGGGLTPSE
eukprot:scaffold276442_cov37-Tisochrysis_lutea.AAC.1